MRDRKTFITVGVAAGVIALLCFLIAATTKPASATAGSSLDQVTVEVPVSCSLTGTVNTEHTATMEVGRYLANIGETTFKVFCNDSNGFAIYAVGYTANTYGNSTMKPTTLDSATYGIATGTATNGNTSNWAMKLSAVSGTYTPTIHATEDNGNTHSFTQYHAVPSEYTKVASFSSNTDATVGATMKSTYAAYIAQDQAADTYTGKVKYTIVHPANAATPGMQISDLTYMQDFVDLSLTNRASVLASMADSTTYNLIDNRDNKTYAVAKMKDGNVWMAENLDLGRTNLTVDLTSSNTNLSTTVPAATFNGWKKTSGTQTYDAGGFIPITASNSYDGLDTDPTSGTAYGTLYNYYAASAGTIKTSSNSSNAQYDICPAGWRLPTGGSSGEFQALYTEYNSNALMRASIANGGAAFALAGSFANATPTSQGSYGGYWSSTRYNNANMYILFLVTSGVGPAGSDNRSVGDSIRCVLKKPARTLTVSYGIGVTGVTINGITVSNNGTMTLEEGMSYAVDMTIADGYAFDSWSATSGTIGSSSTQSTAYTIGTANATLTATASFTGTYIQNLSASSCTTTASTVYDSRDNHAYTIQRLADGKCWMMENLDLGRTDLTTDLTSANTNLSTTVTASTFNGWKKTSGTGTYDAGEFINVSGSDATSGTAYGTLYNYYAASAGTISGDTNSSNATYDICPAGWRLPTGGSSGEFQTLYTQYNSNALMGAPIASAGAAFALAGYFTNATPKNQGSSGNYWSSTRDGNSNMYNLLLSTSYVIPASSNTRRYGNSIRCILSAS